MLEESKRQCSINQKVKKGGDENMEHDLTISIAKKPKSDGVVNMRSISVRERFLRSLLGKKCQLTIIVPGDTVREIEIKEAGKENA